MFYADAHCDTLYSLAVEHKPAHTLDITVERLKKMGAYLQTFAMFVGSGGPAGEPYQHVADALSRSYTLGIPIYRGAMPDMPPTDARGVLAIEGGEALEGSLERFEEFAHEGVRMITLTWNFENEIATAAAVSPEGGIKEFGKRLIGRMNERGVLCDVSHLNEAGFWDVMDLTALPPVASHSCVRELCNHRRNLWRDQVRAIIDRQGFIGVNFYPHFLLEGNPANVSVQNVIEHIDELVQMGAIDSVGLGSDFDGIEVHPIDLNNPEDIPAIFEGLKKRGYDDEALAKIAGLNYYRVLSGTLEE